MPVIAVFLWYSQPVEKRDNQNNITELNFAWYAPTDLKGIPIVKVSESPDMKGAMEFKGSSTPAVLGYTSNKVTITDLKEEMTYYYTYGQDEVWSDVTAFETRNG